MIVEALLLLALVGLLLYYTNRKPAGLPPGSFGVPVLGNLPPRHVHITEHFKDQKKKYGNIFCSKWGSRVVVVLADYQLIRKAFNHPELQGRLDVYSFSSIKFFMNIGVIMAEGNVWSENRRFLLRNLRDLGMGKTYLENSIQEEAQMLVEHLENNCLDKPAELDWSINVAVVNVIWQMVAGKRYNADDDEVIHNNKMVAENFDMLQGPVFLVDFMTWIANIIPHSVLNKLLGIEKMYANMDTFRTQCFKIIEEHRQKLDPENPKDVIDFYLLEIDARKEDPDSTYRADLKDLLVLVSDLFAAGSETTASTIRWLVLYMAREQDIQSKIHKIIDESVPTDRLPSLEDRQKLQYIDATLLDVMRLASLLPMGVPHRATATITFEGYTIPKDAMIVSCQELCHRDPAFWERPEELYPEHFLDEDGKLNSKQDGFVPFSTGRRQCLGESLARMELFLFASALLQRFTIEPPPGVTLSTDTNPDNKLLNTPMPFKVVLKKRI